MKTHGWVLPSQGSQPFAVCWNGLVYPVTTVAEKADWRADARSAIQRAVWQWRSAWPEAHGVSPETCLPLKGCLLLRLGEPRLAQALWGALPPPTARDPNDLSGPATPAYSPTAPEPNLPDADPYLDWASDWASELFDRAVCAHMRGDDGLALPSARLLTAARPVIKTEAERRGFKLPRPSNSPWDSPWDGTYPGYLNFLGPVSALLADQERRALRTNSALPRVDVTGLTNQAERIAAFIEQLEEVAVPQQSGQPDGLRPWRFDPVVGALLKEGPAAIEPLLRSLESAGGNRLTRSVSFGDAFHPGRRLHPVSEPAVDILVKLLDASYEAIGLQRFSPLPSVSNAVVAAQLRNYWKNFGQLPLAERWFRRLADDNAGPAAWADALGHIVRTATPTDGPANHPTLAGEALRAKTGPGVTELLVRRAATLARSPPPYHPFRLSDAVWFLLQAEKWEAPPLLPIAAELQTKVLAGSAGANNLGSAGPYHAASIASLAMFRARQGDTAGLDGFAAWVQHANPGVLGDSVLEALEPFWKFPGHPPLRDAARAMFGNTNSPWGTLAWLLEAQGHLRWFKPLASPVLIVPEVRALVLAELANHAPGGEAINRGGGNLEVKHADDSVINYGARMDLEGMEVGAKVTFRRCDVVAEQLSAIRGFPQFSLLWPEAKRDAAVNAIIELLTKSGARLRAREKPPGWSFALDPPLVELPQDHK